MDGGIDNFDGACSTRLWEPSEWGDEDHHEDLWSILMSSSIDSVSFAFDSSYDTKLHIQVPRS